jgi:inosose dehydratase
VHLKDVDEKIATQLRSREIDLVTAVQKGLFRALGAGDVAIAAVVTELERSGYLGWYVLEQDVAILGPPPEPGTGPALDVRRSIDFLTSVLATTTPIASSATEGR